MSKTASEIFRDYATDGVPASGVNQPNKRDVREWAELLEATLGSVGLAYATLALLNADLLHGAATLALVYNDAVPSNNGTYVKSGASGAGSWSRSGDLPSSLVRLTVTGGTANAIVATAPETPQLPGNKLYLLTPTANNTGAVTISVNSGALSGAIKSALNTALVTGSLTASLPVLMAWQTDHFQLLVSLPVDATGVLTDAQAAAAAAAASAASAAAAVVGTPKGRVTLTSGVAVTTSDVTGATNVYFTPLAGAQAPLYNGTSMAAVAFTELTLPLNSNAAHTNYHQGGRNFDCFFIDDAGTKRFGTGPSWNAGAVAGSDTARGTGAGSTELQMVQGIWTNKNVITIRYGTNSGDTVSVPANRATYLGTIRTTADGVTEDSAVKRFVYNAYNPSLREFVRKEAAASWASVSTSLRQMNGNTANQFEYVAGLTGSALEAVVLGIAVKNTSGVAVVAMGVGLDSTTVDSASLLGFGRVGDTTVPTNNIVAHYRGYAQLGYRKVCALEKGASVGGETFFGAGSGYQAGIIGSIFA